LYLFSGDFIIGVALVIDEKLFFLFIGSTTGWINYIDWFFCKF